MADAVPLPPVILELRKHILQRLQGWQVERKRRLLRATAIRATRWASETRGYVVKEGSPRNGGLCHVVAVPQQP
eukprot:416951-Pleurochrysis_carterae.AAC.1